MVIVVGDTTKTSLAVCAMIQALFRPWVLAARGWKIDGVSSILWIKEGNILF